MPPNPKSLLLVDDDAGLLRQLRWAFSDHKVFPAGTRHRLFNHTGATRQVLVGGAGNFSRLTATSL